MKRLHLILASVLLGLSLGVDYPFSVFLVALVLALWWVDLIRVRLPVLFGFLVIALGVPFVVRQIQVATVLGVDFWFTDFRYSILRRIPLTSLVLTVTDSVTLSRYYQSHRVIVWPGGGGPYIPLTWAFVLIRAHAAAVGLPSLVLVLAALYAGWIRNRVQEPMRSALSLLVAIGISVAATLVVFGEYTSIFYGALLMPMAVHWVILLLGLTSYVLVAHRRCKISFAFCAKSFAIPIGALLLTAFVLWRVGTEARNIAVLPPMGYPGRHALAELKGHSVATLWISSAPSAYTDQWGATLQTMRWLVKSPHRFVFNVDDDYYMFFETDRDNPRYQRPDFLLIPRLQVWGMELACQPLSGWVISFANSCVRFHSALAAMGLPVYRGDENYRLYDLRQLRGDGR